MSGVFYPLDVVLAAERRQRDAMAAHRWERWSLFEVKRASSSFWPQMMSIEGYFEDEARERRDAWIVRMGGRTSTYRTPSERLVRRERARAMRDAGAPFEEIAAELGVSPTQARVLARGKS